jgi:transcriptional regulator with XRE-family HTH domain
MANAVSRRPRVPTPPGGPTLADRLRDVRKAHGFTQEQLSEATGISQGQVSKAERSEAVLDSDQLIMWAIACGVQPQDLMPKVDLARRPQPTSPGKGKVLPMPTHPSVKSSLDSYIERKRHVLNDVQLKRLRIYARGVDPSDENIPVDDELWDALAGLIYSLYKEKKAP